MLIITVTAGNDIVITLQFARACVRVGVYERCEKHHVATVVLQTTNRQADDDENQSLTLYFVILLVITSAKEVVFYPAFVCLSVCLLLATSRKKLLVESS